MWCQRVVPLTLCSLQGVCEAWCSHARPPSATVVCVCPSVRLSVPVSRQWHLLVATGTVCVQTHKHTHIHTQSFIITENKENEKHIFWIKSCDGLTQTLVELRSAVWAATNNAFGLDVLWLWPAFQLTTMWSVHVLRHVLLHVLLRVILRVLLLVLLRVILLSNSCLTSALLNPSPYSLDLFLLHCSVFKETVCGA